MSINFENALGIHEDALNLRSRRAEVLANNLVNADTPGFKARDVDFQAALNNAQEQQGLAMQASNPGHMTDRGEAGEAELLYRNPSQPAIDGNTVDAQVEMANYTRNAMDFQASFQFLNGRFQGLMTAIRGD